MSSLVSYSIKNVFMFKILFCLHLALINKCNSMNRPILVSIFFLVLFSCQNIIAQTETAQNKLLLCNLTESQMTLRKDSVLNTLKILILEKQELENGYAFRFPGTDQMMDSLTTFIKSERKCCTFFVFGLFASSNMDELWLKLSGPEGTKEFIDKELGW